MATNMKELLCMVLYVIATRADAQFVAVAGSDKTLVCPSCYDYANNWLFNWEKIVEHGVVLDIYTHKYSTSCDVTYSQCYLTLVDVSLQDAGLFQCCDMTYEIRLTVLGLPYGEMDPAQYVFESDNVTLSCYVDYVTDTPVSVQPILQWTDENYQLIYRATEMTDIHNKTVTSFVTRKDININVYTFSSLISIYVPFGSEFVPSYNCTLYFQLPITLNSVYVWTSPHTELSYCPRDVQIGELDADFTVNSSLRCTSSSRPVAVYRWRATRGRGVVSGPNNDTFVLTQSGFFNVTCTAVLDIVGTADRDDTDCQATAHMTGFVVEPCKCRQCQPISPGSSERNYKPAVIGLAVVFSLTLVALVVVAVLYLRTSKAATTVLRHEKKRIPQPDNMYHENNNNTNTTSNQSVDVELTDEVYASVDGEPTTGLSGATERDPASVIYEDLHEEWTAKPPVAPVYQGLDVGCSPSRC